MQDRNEFLDVYGWHNIICQSCPSCCRYSEVLVLEKEFAIGTGTSSRNSEVVHAGFYYPQASLPLKARFCVEGRRRLYEFCDAYDVTYKKCGKLVVAADARETSALETFLKQGKANGVAGLEIVDAAAANQLACPGSPGTLACHAALYSPETGVFNSHECVSRCIIIKKMIIIQKQFGHHQRQAHVIERVERSDL